MALLPRRIEIEQLRDQYRHNLHLIEMQIAQSGGPSSASIKLLNELEITRGQLGSLDGELANLTTAPTSPYRGLRPFDVADANLFFGRWTLIKRLIDQLSPDSPSPRRFLALVGPSGSGKSSLARAGLLGALRGAAFAGSAEWPQVVCTPGADPLENLALALHALTGEGRVGPLRELIADLRRDPSSLHLAVRLALGSVPAPRRLVLLIDQFEELFTLCTDEGWRAAAIAALLHAATAPEGRTLVLLTLRSDFYGACADYPALADALSHSQQLVGPLAPGELRVAIEAPCAQAGASFEEGLVDLLLRDVAGQPGTLPLLQYTLQELWLRRSGATLTHESYRAIGGVFGTLSQRAEVIFNSFDPAQQEICRKVFLQLIYPGEETGDTKRRVRFSALLPLAADRPAFDYVIKRLTDEQTRLLVLGGDLPQGKGVAQGQEVSTAEGDTRADTDTKGSPSPGAAPATIEIAHEALIRNWRRLKEWIDGSRTALLVRQRLQTAVQQWQDNHRARELLYGRLQLAEVDRSFSDADLDAAQQTFVRMSRRRLFVWQLVARSAVLLVFGVLLGFVLLTYERDTRWLQLQQTPQDRVWDLATAASPSPRYYVATADLGVFATSGDGVWTEGRDGLPQEQEPATSNPRSNVRDTYLVAADQQNSLRIFTYVPDRGLFRSDDGGLNWQSHPSMTFVASQDNAPSLPDLRSLAVRSQLMVATDTDSYLYVSMQGGSDWRVIDEEPFKFVYSVAINPNGQTIDIATPDSVYRCSILSLDRRLEQCDLIVEINEIIRLLPAQLRQNVSDTSVLISSLQYYTDGNIYIAVNNSSGNVKRDFSAIYRWGPRKPLEYLASFDTLLTSLTIDPGDGAVYVLLTDNQIWQVRAGQTIPLDPQPPGRANALLAATRPDGSPWLLLGNESGVWEYRRSLR